MKPFETFYFWPHPTDRAYYDTAYQWAAAALNALSRPRAYGYEHLETPGPLIVVSNHVSYLDPLYIGAFLPRETHFMTKREMFVRPFRTLFRMTNMFPVERGGADRKALKYTLDLLAKGYAVVLFPEGTRGDGVHFGPPLKGVGFLATRGNAPVVPVYIDGAHRVLGRGQAWFRRSQVDLFIGAPMTFTRDDDPSGVADTLMTAIGDLRDRRETMRQAVPKFLG